MANVCFDNAVISEKNRDGGNWLSIPHPRTAKPVFGLGYVITPALIYML